MRNKVHPVESEWWRSVRVGPRVAVLLGLLGIAGCSITNGTRPAITTMDVPPELRVNGPQVGAVHASGYQVYTCAADSAGKLAWTLKAPDATFEGSGLKGRHYAGPTWAAEDGSKVTGHKLKDHASPTGDAVAWLLLEAAGHEGRGTLSQVTFIQRIHTTGGKAPQIGSAKPGDEVRVAYTADYVFYGPGATVPN